MIFLFFFVPLFLVITIVRLLTRGLRYGLRPRGYGYSPWGYGYNPYRYGCRRHHGMLGGVLPIIALVALDRMFGRRW